MRRLVESGGALLATAVLAAGCGNASPEAPTHPAHPRAPKVGKITCHAIKLNQWEAVGDKLQADRTAGALGVSPQQVVDGRMGEAECDPAVPSDPVGAGEAVRAEVDGVQGVEPEECLVIGLNSGGHPPAPHHAYRGVIAACAAPPGAQI